MRSPESQTGDSRRPRRTYRMARRAELVDNTRQRIVEATVALHTSVGPAATTVAAIAEAAGVTRLTVYRHFPDAAHLFTACRTHWRDAHPGPDPRRWMDVDDLDARARLGLSELYGWYRANAGDLGPIYRDVGSMPAGQAETASADERHLAAALLGAPEDQPVDPRLVAVARHLVRFATWASLTADGALSDADSARLGGNVLALVERWARLADSRAEESDLEQALRSTLSAAAPSEHDTGGPATGRQVRGTERGHELTRNVVLAHHASDAGERARSGRDDADFGHARTVAEDAELP